MYVSLTSNNRRDQEIFKFITSSVTNCNIYLASKNIDNGVRTLEDAIAYGTFIVNISLCSKQINTLLTSTSIISTAQCCLEVSANQTPAIAYWLRFANYQLACGSMQRGVNNGKAIHMYGCPCPYVYKDANNCLTYVQLTS